MIFSSGNLATTVASVDSVLNLLQAQTRVVDRREAYYNKADTEGYTNHLRYRAQSILTCVVDYPELPTAEQARDIIAWASRSPVR